MSDCEKCLRKLKCFVYLSDLRTIQCSDYITNEDELSTEWSEETMSETTILDSGTRREFETGAVRDMADGKGRFDLMPWSALMEVSKHCENGAKKYGEHNVDKGLPISSFVDSAFRHLAKYVEGWTDEPHLTAATWNLLWAMQTEIKHPELKNVPWSKEANG